jgi:tRNA threonylcarbamoyladenosine modification (KEOPS) complex  Pcc1 subunit
MPNDDEAIVDLYDDNPLTDTGKWRAEIHQRLAEAMQAFEVVKAALQRQEAERTAHEAAMEKLGITIQLSAEDVHKLKAEWEADHAEHITTRNALKRGVMQVLKGIGWID